MTDVSNRAVVDRYLRAHQAQDWDALEAVLHRDYVEEWPQSGERIRGGANVRAILENYPGGLAGTGVGTRRVTGGEDRLVATTVGFGYGITRVSGTGDTFTFEGTAGYGDGTRVHVVAVVEVREGKIGRQTTYFAAPFDAPDWRARWVERTAAAT